VKVYENFIEGVKEGFDVAKNLLPSLVTMLCAVGVLRASGALDANQDHEEPSVDSFPALAAATIQQSTERRSMCWRCSSAQRGFSGQGTRWLVRCWRSSRGGRGGYRGLLLVF